MEFGFGNEAEQAKIQREISNDVFKKQQSEIYQSQKTQSSQYSRIKPAISTGKLRPQTGVNGIATNNSAELVQIKNLKEVMNMNGRRFSNKQHSTKNT